MRITREAFSFTANFAAEMVEVIGRESSFKKCTCINAWCGVALEVNMVSGLSVVFAAKEVIETNFIK